MREWVAAVFAVVVILNLFGFVIWLVIYEHNLATACEELGGIAAYGRRGWLECFEGVK